MREPEEQREALGDLVAVTLALVQRLDDPQGLLVPHCVAAALAVRESVLLGQDVAVTLRVLKAEPVDDLQGLPVPVRETDAQGLVEGDLVGDVLPEEQRVAVAHTLGVGLTVAQPEPDEDMLSLTLEL